MCDFPSWRECPDGSILFLTDKDVKKHKIAWNDCNAHTSISTVFPKSKGVDREGFKKCPEKFWKAILSGKCNKMMKQAYSLDLRGCDIKGITFPENINCTLVLEGCDLKGVTLPTIIKRSLVLEGSVLRGITLPKRIDGYLDLSGCDLKGITFPKSIGGIVYLRGCDLEGIKIPKSFNVIK